MGKKLLLGLNYESTMKKLIIFGIPVYTNEHDDDKKSFQSFAKIVWRE